MLFRNKRRMPKLKKKKKKGVKDTKRTVLEIQES